MITCPTRLSEKCPVQGRWVAGGDRGAETGQRGQIVSSRVLWITMTSRPISSLPICYRKHVRMYPPSPCLCIIITWGLGVLRVVSALAQFICMGVPASRIPCDIRVWGLLGHGEPLQVSTSPARWSQCQALEPNQLGSNPCLEPSSLGSSPTFHLEVD